jgi:hypothetical protein
MSSAAVAASVAFLYEAKLSWRSCSLASLRLFFSLMSRAAFHCP